MGEDEELKMPIVNANWLLFFCFQILL